MIIIINTLSYQVKITFCYDLYYILKIHYSLKNKN